MATRDPKIDPKDGDEMRLLGWRVRVTLVTEDTVYFFLDSPPTIYDSNIHEKPLQTWRTEMGKYGETVKTAV